MSSTLLTFHDHEHFWRQTWRENDTKSRCCDLLLLRDQQDSTLFSPALLATASTFLRDLLVSAVADGSDNDGVEILLDGYEGNVARDLIRLVCCGDVRDLKESEAAELRELCQALDMDVAVDSMSVQPSCAIMTDDSSPGSMIMDLSRDNSEDEDDEHEEEEKPREPSPLTKKKEEDKKEK